MSTYDGRLRPAEDDDAAPTIEVNTANLPDVIPHFRSRFGGLWTDLSTARDLLEGRRALGLVDDAEASQLRHWIDYGYVIIENAVPPGLIDEVLEDLDATLAGELPPRKAEWREPDRKRVSNASSDLMRRPGAKLLDLHDTSPAAQHMIFAPPIARFLQLVFERPPLAFQSVTAHCGTREPVHQDTAFIRVSSALEMAASWIALEDIVEGSGELEYYPRSHALPEELFDGKYKSVPNASSELRHYSDRLHERARKAGLEIERFLPSKGDAILWAADLIHGDRDHVEAGLTRRSFVTHYCPNDREPHYFKRLDEPVKQPSANGGFACANRWF